jgi:hypothetical protein
VYPRIDNLEKHVERWHFRDRGPDELVVCPYPGCAAILGSSKHYMNHADRLHRLRLVEECEGWNPVVCLGHCLREYLLPFFSIMFHYTKSLLLLRLIYSILFYPTTFASSGTDHLSFYINKQKHTCT